MVSNISFYIGVGLETHEIPTESGSIERMARSSGEDKFTSEGAAVKYALRTSMFL